MLSVVNHDRDAAGLTYVYPVVSRRAGGLSVGINLNPNNACNWRCVYCQVPGLERGAAPAIDLALLRRELSGFLQQVVHGDFLLQHVPAEARRLNDIALSGNGEPTSAEEFDQVIDLVGEVVAEFGLVGQIKLVLITNGSLMHRPQVQHGIARMNELNGEVWFKLDRGTAEEMLAVNQSAITPARVRRHIGIASRLCQTWVQTCMFAMDDHLPDEASLTAYLDLLQTIMQKDLAPLAGVLLYGLARPSMQIEGQRLSPAPAEWMQALAERIEPLGLPVKLSV